MHFLHHLKDNICPLGKVELVLSLELDHFLVWKAVDVADEVRIVVTKLVLWVPKLELTGAGKKQYYDALLKPDKWMYNRFDFSTQELTGDSSGVINAVIKPRYVIMWALLVPKVSGNAIQDYNPFAYDNDTLGAQDNIYCTSVQFLAVNSVYYPIQPLNPKEGL